MNLCTAQHWANSHCRSGYIRTRRQRFTKFYALHAEDPHLRRNPHFRPHGRSRDMQPTTSQPATTLTWESLPAVQQPTWRNHSEYVRVTGELAAARPLVAE